MSGMCKPNVQEKHASEPLSIAQFLSAFLLLGIGTAMSLVFIVMEHLYMRYLRQYVDKKNAEIGGCFSLFSQVIIIYNFYANYTLYYKSVIVTILLYSSI
jgi:hypothetical protein